MHHLPKVKAKRSSSETLLERSAHKSNKNEVWINAEPIFPNLICDLLADGHSVKFFAPGDSMYPTIRDGDEITVAPIEAASIITGDIILYREKSGVTAHRVMRVIVHSDDGDAVSTEESKDFSFTEAIEMVRESFQAFEPRIADLAMKVIEEEHIDTEVRPGKMSGAYNYGVDPAMTPYVLLNYNNKARDVATLAGLEPS